MEKARATNHAGKGTSRHNFREFPKKTKEKGKSDINRNLTDINKYFVNGRFFDNDADMKKYFSGQTDFFTKQAFRFRDNEHYKDLTASQKYELACYERLLGQSIKAQHNRNAQHRQQCLDRDALDIMQAEKTQPEETILQIGNRDYCPVNAEQFWNIYKDYAAMHNARFGQHIVILDAVLHADETTLHSHERKTYVGQNKHGEACISKNSALELLGIERPNLNKPQSRYNNRKQTYSALCRDMWITVCKRHGLDLETEPRTYADKHGLELTEYKVQQEQRKLDVVMQERANADRTLKNVRERVKSKAEVLEFVKNRTKEEVQKKEKIQQEYNNLKLMVEHLQGQNLMLEQEIAEQKKKKDKNNRTISEWEKKIAEYQSDWQQVDVAMYVSNVVQAEYEDYYNGIITDYWRWQGEQEQQTDIYELEL